ncbi:hypothetical protein V2J09_003013 [Rumex salicifolius]
MVIVLSKIGNLISRRLFSSVAQKVTPQLATATKSAGAGITRSAAAAGEKEAAGATTESVKDVFWTRDPKTGCWMPENQFNQIDPVDLRIKFLASHQNKLNS